MLLFLFTFLMLWGHTMAVELKVKTFCYGETLELICPDFSQLKVEGASYNILRAGSKLCAHVNITASSCHAVNVTKRVKAKCQDQLKCSVSNEAEKFGNGECKKSLYLTVLYTCEEKTVDPTVPSSNTMPLPTTMYFSAKVSTLQDSTDDGKVSGTSDISYVFWILFSTQLALEYMRDRPRHVILCVVLSASAGIAILIISVLVMACFQRMREERKEKEETDIEISSPLMVTPPEPFNAGPATIPDGYQSLRPNQTLSRSQSQRSQNSLSLRRSRDSHEIQIIRAPSIIRTHSVDEGTQTEFDLDDSGSQDQGLSEEEAQELGYLVDIMKYYNSRLDKPLDTENSDNTQAGPPSSIRAGPSGITQTAPKLPPKMRGSPYTSRLKSSHSTPYSTNHDPMQNHIPVRTQTIDHRPHNDYPRTIPLRKHVEFERQQSGDSSDTYAASVGSKEHSDYIRDVSYTRPLLLNKTPDQPVELKSFGHPRNKVIPNSIGHDHSRSWDASGMDSKLRYVGNGDDLSRPRDLLDGNGPRPRDHVDGDPPAPRAKLRPVDIDSNSTSNSMSDIYSTGNHINHNHIPNNHTNTLGRYNTFSTRTRGRGFAYPSPTSERVSVRQFGTLGR